MEVSPRQEDLTEYSAEHTESCNRTIEINQVFLAPDWQIKTVTNVNTKYKQYQ